MLRHVFIVYIVVFKWHDIEVVTFVYFSTLKVSKMFST